MSNVQPANAAIFNSTNVNSEAALNTALAQGTTGDTINITITSDFTITTGKTITGKIVNITSDATQRTLTRTAALSINAIFSVGAGTTMTVTNLTLDGDKDNIAATNRGAAFSVTGTLNLGDGVIVQNFAASAGSAGGAVISGAGSTISIYGTAIIRNNESGSATKPGGAIGGWGTVTISGDAQIINNSAGNGGGGVYISTGGNLTLSGNAKISGNTATQGGGVFIGSYTDGTNTTFTMNGGEISGNSAYNNGNGVSVDSGLGVARFYMMDGTISGNIPIDLSNTVNDGGGIYANKGTVVGILGGTISDNTAIRRGGAVNLDGNGGISTEVPSWSIQNATIQGNSATFAGGVSVVGPNTTLTVSGNTRFISNVGSGGGLRFEGTNLTVNGAIFDGNSGIWGGGIAFNGTTMTNATISNTTFVNNSSSNSSTGASGGAMALNSVVGGSYVTGNISITDSTFTNNTSAGNGGAIDLAYAQLSQLTIDSSSTFSNNTAHNGFYPIDPSDIPLHNSLIHATQWSQNANYGYNNFDIAYTQTTPQFLIQFNTNGGNNIDDQLIPTGQTATRPDKPTRSGYTFAGWYSDSDLTIPYDFSTPVTANITLYAKWLAGDEEISLSSCSTVGIAVDPGYMSSNSCTVNVTTNSYYGYTLTMKASGPNLERSSGGQTIPSTSGTITSPSGLSGAASAWGFRMDNLGNLGSGPTSAEDNVPSSDFTWAAVPTTDTTIRQTNTATSQSGDDATVWFGVAAMRAQPAGTYKQEILWTVVGNI